MPSGGRRRTRKAFSQSTRLPSPARLRWLFQVGAQRAIDVALLALSLADGDHLLRAILLLDEVGVAHLVLLRLQQKLRLTFARCLDLHALSRDLLAAGELVIAQLSEGLQLVERHGLSGVRRLGAQVLR